MIILLPGESFISYCQMRWYRYSEGHFYLYCQMRWYHYSEGHFYLYCRLGQNCHPEDTQKITYVAWWSIIFVRYQGGIIKRFMHRGKNIHASRENRFMHCKRKSHVSRERDSCIAREWFMHRGKEIMHRGKRFIHSKKKKPCIAREKAMHSGKQSHTSRERDSCIAREGVMHRGKVMHREEVMHCKGRFMHREKRFIHRGRKIYPSQEDQHRLHYFLCKNDIKRIINILHQPILLLWHQKKSTLKIIWQI